jgi:hypothetical protein
MSDSSTESIAVIVVSTRSPNVSVEDAQAYFCQSGSDSSSSTIGVDQMTSPT